MNKEKISFQRERTYEVYGIWRKTRINCVIKTEVGYDIVSEATTGLEKEWDIEGENEITNLEIEEIFKCEGCEYESPCQVDHMMHPSGCLHVSDDCRGCQIEEKNMQLNVRN
uniref:Uncharacterized protein n=1 Tax=Marseillevirus LCMAC101 TaxID=2506602 RepID=A0A481YRL5_9VIRU|nr:MAG: hypothetical protein LCMAC101_02050 [Marseillevirus LCMAC101]